MNLFKKIIAKLTGKKISSSEKSNGVRNKYDGRKGRRSGQGAQKRRSDSSRRDGNFGGDRDGRRPYPRRENSRGGSFRRDGDFRGGRHGRGDFADRIVSPADVKPRASKIAKIPADAAELADAVPEFSALGLSPKTLSAVRDMKYLSPTPIQKEAIPAILAGKDVIGTAQTGTGKTAAFALPVLDMLGKSEFAPRVLVLSPTRELASQTSEAFENFSPYTDITHVLVQGGVAMNPQIEAIAGGVDIVVATPGRLLDLVRQRVLSLKTIQYLILDEVDRMFDMGFIEDVSNIIRYCPKERRTLFFSATMPDAVLRLSEWALTDPVRLSAGTAHSPADTIEHFVYPVDGIQKYDMLIEILKRITFDSLIVFTRTRIDADRIGEWLLAHDYKVSILHSDRSQRERDKALSDFKDGSTNILVATDIASRGLDISNVGYVINYNVPEHSEDYVHRIGRTGRANREGTAVTLYSSEETEFLRRIEAFIDAHIERRKLEGFPYRNEPILNVEAKKPRRRNM